MTLYLLFLLLLCSSAFFSSSETAFFNLSKHRRHQLAQDSRRSARRVAHLRSSPHSLLVTVLFGNELTNIALSIVSASILSDLFPMLSIAQQALLSASIVVPTLLIFGEITPKSIAALLSERVALTFVYPLSFFAWLITPARWALLKIADFFTKILAPNGASEGKESLSEASFRALIDASEREGVLDAEESLLIHNAFQFGDQSVSEVMIPWEKVCLIKEECTISEAIEVVSQNPYSRIPLWNAKQGKVSGILYAKDLLVYRWGDRSLPMTTETPALLHHSIPLVAQSPTPISEAKRCDVAVSSLTHRVIITTPDTSLKHLLETFKRRRKHMAVVMDADHKTPLGICTLEDVLEVIFGPIHEESLSDDELHIDDLMTKIGEDHD